MSSLLPPIEDGFLPIVVMLVGLISLGNVVQSYSTLSYTQRLYPRTAVTPLSARTFGTWTFAVAIVRLYASYHMNEPAWYQMSTWTNVVGLLHYGTEAFVFKSTHPYGPWFAPVGVASTGLVWHLLQYNNYVKY